jgi:hypothetical protein
MTERKRYRLTAGLEVIKPPAPKQKITYDPEDAFSPVFPTSSAYRYYEVKRPRITLRFCYSSHRNRAGYFLSWVERRHSIYVRKDRWGCSRTRKKMQQRMLKLYSTEKGLKA